MLFKTKCMGCKSDMIDRHHLNCGLSSGTKQTQKMMRKEHEHRNILSFPLILHEIYELIICEIKDKIVTFWNFLYVFLSFL